MWKDLWQRLAADEGEGTVEDRRGTFAAAIAGARKRADDFDALFAQLDFALRMADSPVPIDRATVPLQLTFGQEKVKELAAQIKLSPYLRTNIVALLQHYREHQRDLANAERALELARREPALQISANALFDVHNLFYFLLSARERFRDYPLVYQLLGGQVSATTPLSPEAPEELRFFFDGAAPADLSYAEKDLEPIKDPEAVLKTLGVAPLTLEVGLDLVPLIDPALGGELMQRIVPLRYFVAQDLGFVLPGVQVVDNLTLAANTYQIRVRGTVVARGELLIGYALAVETDASSAADNALVGFATGAPDSGRPAWWVAGSEARRAAKLGYEVFSPLGVLLRHLERVVRAQAHEILSLEEVALMLESVRASAPVTVEAVIPAKLELADYHRVLRNLLMEGVSVRDQRTILEALAHAARPLHPLQLANAFGPRPPADLLMAMDLAAHSRPLNDPQWLTERVRVALARQICERHADQNGVIDVVVLDAGVEQAIADAIQPTPAGEVLRFDGARRGAIVDRLVAACQRLERPVVLCAPRIRPFVKQLALRALPGLVVLSFEEIHPAYPVQSIGTVDLVG